MKSKRDSGLPVVSTEGILEGIISEYDLLIQAGSRSLDELIKYTGKVITVYPEMLLKDLLILFYKNKLKRIPVISSKGKLLGMVSRIDLLDKIVTGWKYIYCKYSSENQKYIALLTIHKTSKIIMC